MALCPLTAAEVAAAREAFAASPRDTTAVKGWQSRLGVAADGVPGPLTYAALDRQSPPRDDGRAPADGLRVSPAGLALIKRFEGFRSAWYRDAVGVLTIGYGHTGPLAAGYRSPLTEAQASRMLAERVEREFAAGVRARVTVPLAPHEFDALVSLAYNIGVGAFARASLLRNLNRGRYDLAASGFAAWNRAGGKVLAGLTRRRADEAKMFRGQA